MRTFWRMPTWSEKALRCAESRTAKPRRSLGVGGSGSMCSFGGQMVRRSLLTLLTLCAAGMGVVHAQMPAAVGNARVAVLTAAPRAPTSDRVLLDSLREMGWVEGRNLAIEFRSADGHYDRLPELAAEILRWQPHVVLSVQTPATQALLKLTSSVPIVMVGHGDPVRYGLIKNLARPEANVTGVSFLVNEVIVKTAELLKEAAPRTNRAAVFVNPDNPGGIPVL